MYQCLKRWLKMRQNAPHPWTLHLFGGEQPLNNPTLHSPLRLLAMLLRVIRYLATQMYGLLWINTFCLDSESYIVSLVYLHVQINKTKSVFIYLEQYRLNYVFFFFKFHSRKKPTIVFHGKY